MLYFGYKFVKFFVKLPTFDCKICLFPSKIIPLHYPKTKFKHTLCPIVYRKYFFIFFVNKCLISKVYLIFVKDIVTQREC